MSDSSESDLQELISQANFMCVHSLLLPSQTLIQGLNALNRYSSNDAFISSFGLFLFFLPPMPQRCKPIMISLTFWIGLVVYTLDLIHTFPMEIHVYWSSPGKLAVPTVLFVVGRYSMLLYSLLQLRSRFPDIDSNTA